MLFSIYIYDISHHILDMEQGVTMHEQLPHREEEESKKRVVSKYI